MKGFSLIEIVVAVAILGVLTSIVINTFHTAQLKKEQSGVTQSLVAHLEKQKADTQAGKGGAIYGVKLNADSYVLYKGTYSSNSVTNQNVTINNKFSLSETFTNTNNVIYFSKLYGKANENATITISHIQNQISPQLIVIEQSGTISVIE
jgi:prepilin-type N-terminal cleavage/methylation domain-containing protein